MGAKQTWLVPEHRIGQEAVDDRNGEAEVVAAPSGACEGMFNGLASPLALDECKVAVFNGPF